MKKHATRVLLPEHQMVLLALYDGELGKARPSMTGEELAQVVNKEINQGKTGYTPSCLVNKYARDIALVQHGGRANSDGYIQIISDNGRPRFLLTDAGLEVARNEYADRYTADTQSPEVYTVDMGGGLDTLAARIAANLGTMN